MDTNPEDVFSCTRDIQGEYYVPVLQTEVIVRLVLKIHQNDTNINLYPIRVLRSLNCKDGNSLVM